jgi:hypothetical protein
VSTRSPGLAAIVAGSAAEGGWIAVLCAGADAGLLRRPTSAGVAPFLLAAGVGMLLGGRVPSTGRPATTARLLLALFVGSTAAVVIAVGDPAANPLLSPAPWLLGLAAVRGAIRRGDGWSADASSILLGRGAVALVVPWLLGSAGPENGTFGAIALVGTVAFVGGSMAAVALARLDAIRQRAGDAWDGDRSWGRLVAAAVGVVALLGLAGAVIAGIPAQVLGRAVAGPIGDAVGTFGRTLRSLAAGASGPAPSSTGTPPGAATGSVDLSGAEGIVTLALAIGLIVLVASVVVLARRTPRSRASVSRSTVERRFELPHLSLPARPRLPRRRPAGARIGPPRTAADAYRAVRVELDSIPPARRSRWRDAARPRPPRRVSHRAIVGPADRRLRMRAVRRPPGFWG